MLHNSQVWWLYLQKFIHSFEDIFIFKKFSRKYFHDIFRRITKMRLLEMLRQFDVKNSMFNSWKDAGFYYLRMTLIIQYFFACWQQRDKYIKESRKSRLVNCLNLLHDDNVVAAKWMENCFSRSTLSRKKMSLQRWTIKHFAIEKKVRAELASKQRARQQIFLMESNLICIIILFFA